MEAPGDLNVNSSSCIPLALNVLGGPHISCLDADDDNHKYSFLQHYGRPWPKPVPVLPIAVVAAGVALAVGGAVSISGKRLKHWLPLRLQTVSKTGVVSWGFQLTTEDALEQGYARWTGPDAGNLCAITKLGSWSRQGSIPAASTNAKK